MKNNSLTSRIATTYMKDSVQVVMDILEKEDGKSFEEKKEEIIEFLKGQEDALLAERVFTCAMNDEVGKHTKEKFWQQGECFGKSDGVVLRKIKETDKEKFIELYNENAVEKSILKEESYQNLVWKEHNEPKSLMFSIDIDNEYAGYCGIKNVARTPWEISIELLQRWHRKGIGYAAISTMLDEIAKRLDVRIFRVRIDPSNYASQKLFEKLGATPNGVSEFMLHKEEEILKCEEESIHLIDDKMIALADRFNVEPRMLLSHVLEYELKW